MPRPIHHGQSAEQSKEDDEGPEVHPEEVPQRPRDGRIVTNAQGQRRTEQSEDSPAGAQRVGAHGQRRQGRSGEPRQDVDRHESGTAEGILDDPPEEEQDHAIAHHVEDRTMQHRGAEQSP